MRVFSVSDEQLLAHQEWDTKHARTCPFYDDGSSPISPQGAAGGAETWCFTQTGLGVIVVVKCACGAEENLTEYHLW